MREVNDEPHLVLCACFHLTHRMQALNLMYLSPQDLPCSLETSFLWDNQDRNIQLSEEAVCQSSRRWVSAFLSEVSCALSASFLLTSLINPFTLTSSLSTVKDTGFLIHRLKTDSVTEAIDVRESKTSV